MFAELTQPARYIYIQWYTFNIGFTDHPLFSTFVFYLFTFEMCQLFRVRDTYRVNSFFFAIDYWIITLPSVNWGLCPDSRLVFKSLALTVCCFSPMPGFEPQMISWKMPCRPYTCRWCLGGQQCTSQKVLLWRHPWWYGRHDWWPPPPPPPPFFILDIQRRPDNESLSKIWWKSNRGEFLRWTFNVRC